MRSSYLLLHPDAAGRATDFQHPLEILEDCHDHIAHHCLTLRSLAEYLRTSGCDRRARGKAGKVLHRFQRDSRCHHDDEELDLFPAILAKTDDSNSARVGRLVSRLQTEHRELESLWSILRPQLDQIARGESTALSQTAVERFAFLHCDHMLVEEEQLMPLARSLLSSDELARLGQSMAARHVVID